MKPTIRKINTRNSSFKHKRSFKKKKKASFIKRAETKNEENRAEEAKQEKLRENIIRIRSLKPSKKISSQTVFEKEEFENADLTFLTPKPIPEKACFDWDF